MYSLGCDIGGTFTDFAIFNQQTGEVDVGKYLTTPQDPSEGVLKGANNLKEMRGDYLTETEKIIRIAMEILELELVESNPSAIGEAVFNDKPSCFVNQAGQVAIVLEGKVYQNWNPLGRWDHAGTVVTKIKERFGYIFNIEGPFEDGRWIICILSCAKFADRKTVASAIETGLPATICEAALATLED